MRELEQHAHPKPSLGLLLGCEHPELVICIMELLPLTLALFKHPAACMRCSPPHDTESHKCPCITGILSK